MQQNHTESALADTTTNREWQLIVKQLLVEVKLFALFLAFYLKLAQQALLVDTNTHARKLKATTQNRIPYQDIAVQSGTSVFGDGTPVVVVRSTSVVLLAVAQLSADTDHEYSSVLLADGILTLFRCFVGIHLQQFLGMYKVNLLWQEWLYLRISLAGKVFSTTNSGIYALYYILKECQSTVFLTNNGLPVPLINIQRVQVVKLLVGTNGVHISIDAISRLYLVFCQTQSLPFCKRVHHLGLGIAQILDREAHGALHTIQIVVNTKSFQHEEWCRYSAQSQFCR